MKHKYLLYFLAVSVPFLVTQSILIADIEMTEPEYKPKQVCTWVVDGTKVTVQSDDIKNIKRHSRWHGESKEGCE